MLIPASQCSNPVHERASYRRRVVRLRGRGCLPNSVRRRGAGACISQQRVDVQQNSGDPQLPGGYANQHDLLAAGAQNPKAQTCVFQFLFAFNCDESGTMSLCKIYRLR